MKILHTESSCGWGGQEVRVLGEAAGLRARGHEVVLACPAQATIFREAARYGVEAVALPIEAKRLAGLRALRGLLRARAFDVVNTHSSTDSWLVALACASLRSPPAIVRTRHVSTDVRPSWSNRWLYGRAASEVVTTGERLRETLVTTLGLDPARVRSVPTGIDVSRFVPQPAAQARRALGLAPEGFVVGIVATLRSWKGHAILIEAFERCRRPGDRLIIVGDGPQHQNLEREIAARGLREVAMLAGRRDDPERWIPAFDVFCLPSYANEGISQALMQAMACGVPCITCDVGSLGEVAEDGRTALVVPPKDAAALAEAIARLRADAALRERLAASARARVLERHTFERMCDAMLDVFSAAVARSRRAAAP